MRLVLHIAYIHLSETIGQHLLVDVEEIGGELVDFYGFRQYGGQEFLIMGHIVHQTIDDGLHFHRSLELSSWKGGRCQEERCKLKTKTEKETNEHFE